jgi:hypothetical protein
MSSPPHAGGTAAADSAPPVAAAGAPVAAEQIMGSERVLTCRGGPLDRARLTVPPGVRAVAAPGSGAAAPGLPFAALYRVERRRRARGAAFDVLVHVRNFAEESELPARP